MSFLSLKVNVVDQQNTKTLQFPGNMTIGEVCREIRDKIGDQTSGASDHGIYFPFLMKWLASNKTLDSYDIKSGDTIDYKKKHRPLRVKLMDETMKTVLIDESFPVAEIVDTICKRIGISNPDEYSLLRDETGGDSSIGTLKRRSSKENISAEENRWLNPEKSLSEQGINEVDVLLLKKKFFFSDQNIDRNDPIQLNLVYVQSRDAIITGKHPCTFEEAAQLAALQCQVQFGNHEPDKHKPGFIKIKEFIPPEYHKEKKELEKKVFQEHRKLQGLTEINAKFRYVQLCRSLKTYGVTFFLVKEKVAKKSKLEPVLLGVTRDRIMRVEATTKDLIKEWPLTTLRRWAASPNSFTLDFGDYADAYYSVQTSEGEQISQLIAGYIDIIMKKKKESARAVQDEEEQLAISEESVRPVKATALAVMSSKKGRATEIGVAMAGVVGDDEDHVDAKQVMRKKQFAHGVETVLGEGGNAAAQSGLLQNINNGFAAVNAAVSDLSVAAQLPPIGNDPASVAWKNQTMDMNKQTISTQIGSQIAATAALVNLTSIPDPEKIDYATIGTSISGMSSNMAQIASSAKMLAALLDGLQGDKLLDAARALSMATQKVLQGIQPFITGDAFEANSSARQQLLTGGQELSKNAFQLLFKLGEVDVPQSAQQELIEIAKQVAQATVALVTQGVKPVANECSSSADLKFLQPEIINIAKKCASAAEALVATTIIAAPAVHLSANQDQIFQGTLFLKDGLEDLQRIVEPVKRKVGSDARIMQELNKHTSKIRDAIVKLVNRAKSPLSGSGNEDESELDKQYDVVLNAVANMIADHNESGSIISNAKGLTVAATQLVNIIKASAESENETERNRLLAAAKQLAEVTTKMVGCAKDASRVPGDVEKQQKLEEALFLLEEVTMSAAGTKMRKKLLQKLIAAAKQTANSSTQLITAAKQAAPSNLNQESQMQLNQAAKKDADTISNLVSATRTLLKDIDDPNNQLKLISAAKQSIGPGESLVSAAKEAAATTRDDHAQNQLLNTAKKNHDDLAELQRLVEQAETASAGLDFTTALETLQAIQNDIIDAKKKAVAGSLRPSVFQNMENITSDVTENSKNLNSAVAQLLAAASQGNEKFTGAAARDVATNLQTYSTAVKGLAALTLDNPDIANKLLENAGILAKLMLDIINSSKNLSDSNQDSSDAENLRNYLIQASKNGNDIIGAIYELLPGQRDVDQAMQMVSAGIDLLENGPIVKNSGETFLASQNKLNAAASALAVACNALVSSARNGNAQEIKAAANQFEEAYNKMIAASQSVVAHSDDAAKGNVIEYAKQIAENSSKLLSSMKGFTSDSAGMRNNLNASARLMADSISKLLEQCTQNAPGTTECNRAEQTLIMASGKLDSVNDPWTAEKTENYFESLKTVTDVAKQLVSSMAGISSAARAGDTAKIGQSVLDGSIAIATLTDSTARAAYLIGVSDPSSTPAIAGILDQQQFVKGANEVKKACINLLNPKNNQEAILSVASIIAKNTASLCNNAKQASQNNKISGIAKQQFQQSAKNVAGATAALVASIKQLAVAQTQAKFDKCEEASRPLLDAIDGLVVLCSSAEFTPLPAKISPLALQKQQPLIEGNRDIINLTQDLVGTAKSLCSGRADPSSMQLIVSQAKGVSDALRNLANAIKQGAPGQKDCEEAIEQISTAVGEIDSAILQADIGNLSLADSNTTSDNDDLAYRDALLDNVRAISSLIQMICNAAKGEIQINAQEGSFVDKSAIAAGQLGNSVLQLASNFQPTISNAINLASCTRDKNFQKVVLEQVKDIADNTVILLTACKEAGGDPAAQAAHKRANDAQGTLESSLNALSEKLEGSTVGSKEISAVVKNIELALRRINDNPTTINGNYQLYAQELFKNGKALIDLVGDAVAKSSKPSGDNIISLSENIEKVYSEIISNSQKASTLSSDPKVKQNLLDIARELGGGSMKLVDALKAALVAASNGGTADASTRQKVTNASREVSSQVAKMMNVAKEGSKGLMVCEQVKALLEDSITDLESQIIFAQAGQLDPISSKENFSLYKEVLTNLSRDILESSKAVVSSAASGNQEDLAQAVNMTSTHIVSLRDNTKKGATSITSSDKNMQVQLLSSTKSVSEGLLEVINCALTASGKPMTISATGTVSAKDLSADVMSLRNAAKALVNQINEFARIIKLLGDESSRGLRTIEGATKEIADNVVILSNGSLAIGTALPEEVAAVAKSLATAAASLVSVSSRGVSAANQDDLVSATNQLKKEVTDLLRCGKAATEKAPEEKRLVMNNVLKKVAESCMALLNKVKRVIEEASPAAKTDLQTGAKDIAMAVNSVVESAGSLIPGGYVDPNDPNVIAERELLAAANAIEAAARKLAMLKPPEKPKEANEDLNFEEQILEAAKSIASATSALVRSATAAQREIVAKGKSAKIPSDKAYFSDGTWSDGLVSAAKAVAIATSDLCEAANAAVKGEVQRERVVAAARAVNASTQQLLSSASVKADTFSQSQVRLKAAGKSVTQATEQLVKAAEESMAFEDAEAVSKMVTEGNTGTQAMQRAKELEAQSKVLQMEKELEMARGRLAGLRKGKYQAK